ncbi:MAG: hypothetical protein N3Z29_08255 [Synechococcaceae cyanobacterium MAG-AL1]|nr:hypothetical protein [Candidatus Regnicoccus frigidus MAG-AL1]
METVRIVPESGRPAEPADVTLLATADWGHPFWTNKQHVAFRLAKLGHRVLYVESLGLRALQAGGSDWRWVLQRLWVWSPLVLPGASGGAAAWLNRQVLRLGLARCRRRLGLRRDWLWTYNPRTLEVLDARPYARLIYHCFDAIQAQPDMPAAAIDRAEARLCAEADAVFVTSPQLLALLSLGEGHLSLDDISVSSVDMPAWQGCCSQVPQFINLPGTSVIENMALEAAQLNEFVSKLP